MRRKPYPNREDGMRVWLDESEVRELLDEMDGLEQQVASLLGARVGLRREEIVQVTPADLVETDGQHHLRVREEVAKHDHYREPPVPDQLAHYVEAFADTRDVGPEEPIISVTGRTVYRWVTGAAARLQEKTGDAGWSDVDVHDLRRTWGTALLEDGVIPSVVMDWGGWRDWDTFRRHYLGEFSPRALRRERSKVRYLEGDDVQDVDRTPVAVLPGSSSRPPTEAD